MSFYLTVEAEDEYGDTIEATVDSEDMLDEIGDSEIIRYLEERGYAVMDNLDFERMANNADYFALPKYLYTKTDLYEHLCNIVDVGYCESKEEVLKKLSEKL